MTVIKFNNSDVTLNNNESVLDGLLRNGFDVACGCKAGICQSCLVSVDQTQDSLESAQQGVSDTQKTLGYVLSCQFKPLSHTKIHCVNTTGKQIQATVIDKVFLSDQVVRIRLKSPLQYDAAQYVTLYKNENIARSYSIVSHSKYHDFIELHIRILKDGEFSQWIKNDVWVGHKIGMQGPMGHCVYNKKDVPLLLIGTGTGIAPIYGILQDALINGHKNEINIVYAGMRYKDLYLLNDINILCRKYPNIKLHVITQLSAGVGAHKANVYKFVKRNFNKLEQYQAYVCGVDSFVDKIKNRLIENGLDLANLKYERFLSFKPNGQINK